MGFYRWPISRNPGEQSAYDRSPESEGISRKARTMFPHLYKIQHLVNHTYRKIQMRFGLPFLWFFLDFLLSVSVFWDLFASFAGLFFEDDKVALLCTICTQLLLSWSHR